MIRLRCDALIERRERRVKRLAFYTSSNRLHVRESPFYALRTNETDFGLERAPPQVSVRDDMRIGGLRCSPLKMFQKPNGG